MLGIWLALDEKKFFKKKPGGRSERDHVEVLSICRRLCKSGS